MAPKTDDECQTNLRDQEWNKQYFKLFKNWYLEVMKSSQRQEYEDQFKETYDIPDANDYCMMACAK